MQRISFAHIVNSKNVGDRASGPYNYFTFGPDVEVVDLRQNASAAHALIYGGGAIAPHIKPISGLINIAWGVGYSRHGKKSPGNVPQGFDLFGSREWNQPGALYAPCASCMSSLFDQHYDIKKEHALFLNTDTKILRRYPVNIKDIPSMSNRHPLPDIINFLGSAETVITNSYHGAYWATLLGRKVIVVCAYSSKFFNFRHKPAICLDDDWRRALSESRTYPEALKECRKYTIEFKEKVDEFLDVKQSSRRLRDKACNKTSTGNVTQHLAYAWPTYFGIQNYRKNDLFPALPDTGVDLSLFRQSFIPYIGSKPWTGRKKNITDHYRALEPEFGGHSRLCHLLACTIAALRRAPEDSVAAGLFSRIVNLHGEELARQLNSRWLTAVCDTVVDTSTSELDRAAALTGSLFSNTIKLNETAIKLFYPPIKWPPQYRLSRGGELYDGIITFWIENGDAIDNLVKRINATLTISPTVSPFIKELIQRAMKHDTHIGRIARMAGKKAPPVIEPDRLSRLKKILDDM